MTCQFWDNSKEGPERKSVWICDPWNSYLRTIEEQCEQARIAYELEQDLQRERELQPETEVQEPEEIEEALVLDWFREEPEDG